MLENLVKEFIEYLDGYADLTIEIYSGNFKTYLEFYLKENAITFLTKEDIKELSEIKRYQYDRKTHYEHKGKGYSNFVSFFKEKITLPKHSIVTTNQILYGPPGTGKTYATKRLAVKLISPNTLYTNTKEDRKLLVEHYNELVTKGQIVFTTFHQSMSYEDFVEGIKPKTENGKVVYDVEDGIFKKLASKAKGVQGNITEETTTIDFKSKNYFKMSIGGRNRKDVHDWCIENDYIALGYGSENDLSLLAQKSESEFKENFPNEFSDEYQRTPYSVTATANFIYGLKKGDVVLVSLGNHIIDAVGIVEDDYEYHEFEEVSYRHFRKVKWLGTNLDADPSLFVDKNISQQTIYQFNNDDIKVDYLEQTFGTKETTDSPKDYVLIIDEINRGNVSAIFGELITLLEPDKRLGQDEAITIKLPYSKTEFGVPPNLHIIGTMNTADRSVEALDTALRRRFEFTEVMPKPELLEDILFDGFNLKEVLETINNRIEVLIDRDHTIGHSYFINIKNNDTEALANAFNNKVVPLLQEYFYGDYGKIGLLLGSGFVEKEENKKIQFADFKYDNSNDFKSETFKLKSIDKDSIIDALWDALGSKKTIKERVEKQREPANV